MKDTTDTYTVVVRDRFFKLTKAQMQRDAPNYFTSHFLDSSGQCLTRIMEISRDPFLFELVLKYLNGYQIFPIHPTLVPPCSTPETAIGDLRADAEFYQLKELVNLCKSKEAPKSAPTVRFTSSQIAVITGYFNSTADGIAPSESFEQYISRFYPTLLSEERYNAASTGMLTLASAAPSQMSRFLIVNGWSERIVRTVVKRDMSSVERWELLGWKRDVSTPGVRHVILFVKIWTAPGFETPLDPSTLSVRYLYGSDKVADTKKMTVVAQSIAADNTANGKLVEMRRPYVQDGKVIQNTKSTIPDLTQYDSITDSFCAAQKPVFGDINVYT
ncbi:glycosyl hydrolase 7 (cellulase C) family, partial [Rhizoctonia solani]